ncbi:phenylacetic acid degradation protein PaaN [Streptomyces rimosus]|uniref:phenylacetic acid degradation protein PaaN n=1 Tax=Streptomyces rimosus TaxID=1927 RepID=UPI0034033CC6
MHAPSPSSTPYDGDRTVLQDLTRRHRDTLVRALRAIRSREHWTPYAEDPDAYGEDAAALGEQAFRDLLDAPFPLETPGRDGTVGPAPAEGGERSPYGFELGITYPHADPAALFRAARAALPGWRDVCPRDRAVVCAEFLARINARSHEFAQVAMHTSGHNFLMAFHAGAVHAQDRGLEAVAVALREQARLPARRRWDKPYGDRTLSVDKTFTVVPRGISLLIGNRVVPTWSGYPGLFASLATGNAVVVKPHPEAVLPLALTVAIAREVLGACGFDPNLVCLAPERPGELLARELAISPEVGVIDYSGGTEFGAWLARNAPGARLFAATSAVNSLLVESTAHYRGLLDNTAFSLALYSGQLCTSTQNLLIPRDGISTDEGHKSFPQVVADLTATLEKLLVDDARAAELLGALYNREMAVRAAEASSGALGKVALASRAVRHPGFPSALIRTPAVVELDARSEADHALLTSEWPGPIAFVAAVDSAAAGIALIREAVRRRGGLSVGGHTRSPEVARELEIMCAQEGVLLSLNLTGDFYVSQSSVYSDLHGSAAGGPGSHTFCDAAFVAPRFHMAEVRRWATDPVR